MKIACKILTILLLTGCSTEVSVDSRSTKAEVETTNCINMTNQFDIGDVVYIKGLFTTGVVSKTYWGQPNLVFVLIKGTNGLPVELDTVNKKLLVKIVD